MSKNIKIGLEKSSSPDTSVFTQLVDIEGNPLFDDAGNPLLTEDIGSLSTFVSSFNSTSAHLNNSKLVDNEVIPVIEVFPEQSAVSTNLLGYNRAETQTSLFSDVSTYGLDSKNWNFYSYSEGTRFPEEWYSRENSVYGKRMLPSFEEDVNEQALILKSYPTQYAFPFGKAWNRQGTTNRYREEFFTQYLNFIAMGKYLYQIFENVDITFAQKNLISDRVNIVKDFELDPEDFLEEIGFSDQSSTDLYNISALNDPDVNYGENLQESFNEIERFTDFWNKIKDNLANFPALVGRTYVNFIEDPRYLQIQSFARTNTRPGYGDNQEGFAVLESKKSFRYQPGRVSGFTFGTRLRSNAASLNNYIEWGAANDTDQYMFQLRGSQFNIIRRSVLPLPISLVERMGLSSSNVNNEYYPVELDNANVMQELVIPRDNWNGDKLDGTGITGYTLQFENVTMFKIEFSWYGAIGAKFYAYVPIDHNEARWVLLHTLVIENGMDKPILKNPDFKFRYLIYSDRSSSIEEPFFIYKYGSSYYVDGGDEGTVRLYSETSDTKSFDTRSSIISVLPKEFIKSSFQSTDVVNQKKLIPDSISVSSTKPVRIDIEEIVGSSNGFHHFYSPSLHKSRVGNTYNISFSNEGNDIRYANGDVIESSHYRKKIIADGIYNVYVGKDSKVLRRSIDNIYDFVLQQRAITNKTTLLDGSNFSPLDESSISARFSEYDYAASIIPIYSNKFKIHFLNPQSRDGEFGSKHFSDFAISFSENEPKLNSNNELVFGDAETSFNLEDNLFVEWTCLEERRNSLGREDTEWEPTFGDRFEIDPRATGEELPKGQNTGKICSLSGEIKTSNIEVYSVVDGEGDYAGLFKIIFESDASVPISVIENSLGVGEIGINNQPTGILFAGPTDDEDNRVFISTDINNRTYVYVKSDPRNVNGISGPPTEIQLRSLNLKSDWKLNSVDNQGNQRFTRQLWTYSKSFSFNLLPLYPVIGLTDNSNINNIIVEEIYVDERKTHTPSWITSPNSGISIVNTLGSSDSESPSNFETKSRLSGTLFDTKTSQPLREGEIINSFFIDTNKPTRIDLSNIFNFDRRNIETGVLNNRILVFSATKMSGNTPGEIEMTLTIKEQ